MSLLVLMHLILLATSLPVEEENMFSRTAVYVSEVEVEEPRHRTTRQAGMSSQKKFSFKLKNQTVELDLELNGFIRDAVNMYVTEKNITRLVERNTSNEEQYGYYQDRKTNASVMVKCKTVKCTPIGTFSINGTRFRLDSNDSLAESTHFVTEVRSRPEDANIKGDTKTRFEYINPKDGRALINGTSINGSSTSGKNDTSKDNSGSRVRRGIPAGVDIIELYIYADEAVVNRFRNLYSDLNTALEMTRQYYSLICNEMDLEYQQVKDGNSAGIDIRLYFKGIHVALDSTGAPWSSNTQDSLGNVDSSKALEQFSVWQRDFKLAKNLSYDHAMAMSGKPFIGSVAGIAWIGTVCNTDDVYLASVIEDRGIYLTVVAVHELGHLSTESKVSKKYTIIYQHQQQRGFVSPAYPKGVYNKAFDSLSSSHDPTNGSCSLGYIMGSSLYVANETTARNEHTFSSCSINDFTNKLNSLGANRCTRQHSFTDQEYTAYRSEPIGGEQLSLDQQCQVYFGAGSYACSKGVDMCYRGIICWTSTGCNGRLYLVLDHSPCQEPSNKWCFRGLCVEKPATPTTKQGQTTTTARPPTTQTTTTASPPTTQTTTKERPPTTTARPPTTQTTTTARPPTTQTTTTTRSPTTQTTTTARPPTTQTTTTARPPTTQTTTTARPPTTQTTTKERPPTTQTTTKERPPTTQTTTKERPPTTQTTTKERPPTTQTTTTTRSPTTQTTTTARPPTTQTTTTARPPTTQTTTTARPPTTQTTTKERPPTTQTTTKERPPTTQTTTKERPPTTQTTTKERPPTTQTTTTARPPTTTGRPPSTTSSPKTTQKPTTTICTIIVTCTRVGTRLIGAGCCTSPIQSNCCTDSMTNPTCSVKRSC